MTGDALKSVTLLIKELFFNNLVVFGVFECPDFFLEFFPILVDHLPIFAADRKVSVKTDIYIDIYIVREGCRHTSSSVTSALSLSLYTFFRLIC